MTCRTIPVPGGIGVVCNRGQRQRYCSTVGCGRTSSRQCDHPVKRRKEPPPPKVGDARVHQERGVLFFVWSVLWLHEGKLMVHTRDPDDSLMGKTTPKPQKISVADWFAKTDSTCDRLLCHRCAKKVDGLELCGPHYRKRQAAA